MEAARMLEKLESYEQKAYEGAYGADWLEQVGENVKFYVKHCVESNLEPSITGLIEWIGNLAE